MLSYNWDHQVVIKRINLTLKERGYPVWIDIERMQGCTVEAMSVAVEDCAAALEPRVAPAVAVHAQDERPAGGAPRALF